MVLDSQSRQNNPREEVAWCTDNFSVILHHPVAKNYFCPQKLNSLRLHNTVSNRTE